MGNTQSDGLLALLLSELQEDDGISALDKERDLEEKVLRQARAEKREIITKTKYGIDSNNNFVIIMECGAKPELKFALKVDVEEITSLSYKESKCIRDCLKLGERGTKINEANFTQWVDILKCKYSNVVQGDRDVFKAITIRPENANRYGNTIC